MKKAERKISFIKYTGIIVLLAAAFAAAFFFMWKSGRLLRFYSPWTVWTIEKQDGGQAAGRNYKLVLKDQKVSVTSTPMNDTDQLNQQLSWETPENLRVQDFLWCDIDYDGCNEMLLLCWYLGEVMPWESGQPAIFGKQWGQHVYIYKPYEGSMHQEWFASRIYMNIAKWEFDDTWRLFYTDDKGAVTRWDWHGWGLYYWGDGYPELKFLVSGDNLIHEDILRQGQKHGNYDFLYENIRKEIEKADIAVLGQETIYVNRESGYQYAGYPLFATPTAVGEAAIKAGFDAAACASNHALDCGTTGIRDTIDFYEKRSIPYFGIGKELPNPYTIVEKKSFKTAFLNYCFDLNIAATDERRKMVQLLDDEERIRKEIAEAKEQSDFTIVIVHWGTEYAQEIDELQQKWSRVFLESGVDAVVGMHPHVLQKTEILENENGQQMPIYYSLGNLVSRQNEIDRIVGGLAEFSLQWTPHGSRLGSASLTPVVTHQTKDATTVYLLSDYTDELAAEHRMKISVDDLKQSPFTSWLNGSAD